VLGHGVERHALIVPALGVRWRIHIPDGVSGAQPPSGNDRLPVLRNGGCRELATGPSPLRFRGMEPISLSTERLTLDQPTMSDVDDITASCSEPVFETFMVTPWPYERQHAEFFVQDFVPRGWSSGDEWTWAIRRKGVETMLGAIGVRMSSGMVGFWLGGPHRGQGVMPEALTAVVDAVFELSDRSEVLWECVRGNSASLQVAKKVGFRFTGEAPGTILGRDGSASRSWTGRLTRTNDRNPQSGWPA